MGAEQPQSIRQVLKQMMTTTDGNIIEAKVISAAPLRVRATNDEKLELSAATLVVPRHLTDYATTVTLSLGTGTLHSATDGEGVHQHSGGAHGGHTGGDGSHTHSGDGQHGHRLESFSMTGGSITVHNALKVGELVYLLPYGEGKKYYILDRRG